MPRPDHRSTCKRIFLTYMALYGRVFVLGTYQRSGGGGGTDSDTSLLCVLMRAVCSSDSAAHRDRGTKYHQLKNTQHWPEAD